MRTCPGRFPALFLAVFSICWLPACALLPPRPVKSGETVHIHKARVIEGPVQKWNPVWWLGNADTTEPPDDYRPGSPNRRTLWYFRNPFHNFTFYVIGVADKDFIRRGIEPGGVFVKGYGWNRAVIQRGWLRLPFVSYAGKHVKWYVGWREAGNFGMKWNFMREGNKEAERSLAKKAMMKEDKATGEAPRTR